MFIFSALFGILMLPFTLLRMAFGLLGVSTSILLWPLRIIARNLIASVFIAGGLILYFALKSDPRPLEQLKPAPAESRNGPQLNGPPPAIDPVSNYEDGDSVFSADLYQNMNQLEKEQYSKTFYAVMRSVPDGRDHIWTFYNIQGTIKPTRTFKNKTGNTCRAFTEVLKVHSTQQTLSGTACANANGAWCKLKPNATPVCGLGYSPGVLDGLQNSIKNLF